MSREDFLSSNLYGMRDRLRRNTERIQAEKGQREVENDTAGDAAAAVMPEEPPVQQVPAPDADVNPAAAPAEVPEKSAPRPPVEDDVDDCDAGISLLPTISIPHEGSAAGRERREFEGSLLRDCAFADELLQRSRRDLQALQEFRSTLFCQLRALRELDEKGRGMKEQEYSRQLARLRGEYLYGSGKFDAVIKRGEKITPPAPAAANSVLPKRFTLYLILGLLFNALIIAAGFFCAWKRW